MIKISDLQKSRISDKKYKTCNGDFLTIIGYGGNQKFTVKFSDGTIGYNKGFDHIEHGKVSNPNFPSCFGKGYFGVGIYSTKNKIIYDKWFRMLERCYNINFLTKNPSYKGCTVCDEWLNYQTFAKWCDENNKYVDEKFHLDKDILFKGNKIYSPKTCCFVPQEINKLFTKSNTKRGDNPIGVSKSGINLFLY